MREHRAASGKLIYYMTRHELECLPGYRMAAGGQRGRACCPIHDGDNPTALAIDWRTGWAACWSCGDAFTIRVEDHPDTIMPGNHAPKPPPNLPQTCTKSPPKRHHPEHDIDALRARLSSAIDTAAGRLPGSLGETYLAGRGIPLDVARSLRLGWGTADPLAGRVIFPLCTPDGQPTSATGRTPDNHAKPKYRALGGDHGYLKTLFNGGAIARARMSGHPLVIVEGPLDAAACVTAGLPLAVALCGSSYAHPEHFSGLRTVILALDTDAAGQAGRRALWLDLTARGVEVLLLPATALAGAKDLGEYWQRHRALPGQLAACVTGPHMQCAPATPMEAGNPHARPGEAPWSGPTIAELHQRTAEPSGTRR